MSDPPSRPTWLATWGTVLLGLLLVYVVVIRPNAVDATFKLALLAAFCTALGIRKALTGDD